MCRQALFPVLSWACELVFSVPLWKSDQERRLPNRRPPFRLSIMMSSPWLFPPYSLVDLLQLMVHGKATLMPFNPTHRTEPPAMLPTSWLIERNRRVGERVGFPYSWTAGYRNGYTFVSHSLREVDCLKGKRFKRIGWSGGQYNWFPQKNLTPHGVGLWCFEVDGAQTRHDPCRGQIPGVAMAWAYTHSRSSGAYPNTVRMPAEIGDPTPRMGKPSAPDTRQSPSAAVHVIFINSLFD